MKTRNAVRLLSLSLAAVIVSTGFLIKEVRKNNRYSLELKNTYSKSFDDFNSAVNNISVALNKLKYVSTKTQASRLATTLLAEAEISKTALSGLPETDRLTTLNRFFSQVGNYAMAVAKSLGENEEPIENAEKNLSVLTDTAEKIAEASNIAQASVSGEDWGQELESIINQTEVLPLTNALSELEGELTDFPTLIYDGPYSDHLLEKSPTLTDGAKTVTEIEALAAAALFSDTDSTELILDGSIEGHIPSYRFKGDSLETAVSKQGGHTLYMRKYRAVGTSILSTDQAREKAKRYLSRTEMHGFKETYYFLNENILTVNYCYVDGETLCYTDLIKVGVAMDNGEIVLYEAAGFISNHRDRVFETPAYSPEDAEAVLKDTLEVNGYSIALIPTPSGEEIRCYEFSCTTDDSTEILVYINLLTLEEEEILILLKSDGGTLVK